MSGIITKRANIIPGPQDYKNESMETKPKAPMYSMHSKSKSTQKIIVDDNCYKPEPTKYNTQGLGRVIGVVFGSSNRKDLTETERTPAPNNYGMSKCQY